MEFKVGDLVQISDASEYYYQGVDTQIDDTKDISIPLKYIGKITRLCPSGSTFKYEVKWKKPWDNIRYYNDIDLVPYVTVELMLKDIIGNK